MSQPVASTERVDRSAAAVVRNALHRDVDALAVVAVVLLVAGAVVSDFDAFSGLCVGLGLLLGLPGVWTRRDDAIVRAAVAVGGVWIVYGALVGSLPSPTSPGDVRAWATTEGRVMVPIATIAIARGLRTTNNIRVALCSIVWFTTIAHAAALMLHALGWSVGPFRITMNNGLFVGLSSSHHVVGFVAAVVVIVVLAVPGWFNRWEPTGIVAISLWSIAASGSRSALLGVVAGGLLIAVKRLRGRRAVVVGITIALVASAYVATNERFRTTVDVVTRPEFASEVSAAWNHGEGPGIRRMSDSAAEANLLLRIRAWGLAWDDFANSPLIGMGVFRGNDADLSFTGPKGVVYVATSGEKAFNDREPHNVGFYLLKEVGVLGLVLFSTPFVMAWRSRRDDEPHESGDGDAADFLDPDTAAVLVQSTILMAIAISMVSSGLAATGLGLAANTVIFGAAGTPIPLRRRAGVAA